MSFLSEKMSSGRFLLTIMSGIAFLTFCTVVALVLYQKASEWPEVTIVALVMFFGRIIERVWEMYFGKNRDYENQNKTPVK